MSQEQPGRASVRHIAYTVHSYAADEAHDTRYQSNGKGPEPD